MNIHRSLVFLVFCFVCIGIGKAQQSPQPVLFKSGPYLSETTIADYIANPQLYKSQQSDNTWYGVFQYKTIPTIAQQNLLTQNGITIVGYIPNNAYVVVVPTSFDLNMAVQAGVTGMFQLKPEHKMSVAFYNGEIPEWAKSSAETIDVVAELFENIASKKLIETINNKHVLLLSNEPEFHKITLRIPAKSVTSLAALPFVLWLEPVMPKISAENVPGKTLARSNVLSDGIRTLTGKDVKIGIWDGGVVGPHLDFMGRLTVVQAGTSSDHATHVAGTMAGAGNIDPKARGMAPKALVYGYDYNGSVNSEIAGSIVTDQIVISQHSYGFGDAFVNCTTRDPYNTNSREQDINIANNPYFLHLHSAGNSQTVCTGGWGTTTGKAAKNMMVVANVASNEAINGSSSFGPVNDGRLKPEISAVGVDVFSTFPNNGYMGGYTGTSMATPVVSGVSAQLYERYRQLNSNNNPPASLLKAVMCNTAKDVGNAGPDYKYGYGILNGLKAVKTIEDNNYVVNTIGQSTTQYQGIVVPTGATSVKVTLCWTDVPALANANPALVNDLDLVLRDPLGVAVLPWILNPASPATVATMGLDRKNNSEQITINNPMAGTYTIEVNGFLIPVGTQQYAVTWDIETPYMTLTYPTGNEHLVPGTSTTIHWDNAGITGTQTLQYSTNGGSSWTNISTTIAANLKQFTWTVPSLNGAKALIKISSGAYSDVSDSAFNIINTPGTISFAAGCTSGEVKVIWPAVTGATHYDIVSLNSVTGDWDTLLHAGNTLSANVQGLTLGQTYWFAVIARNNTVGAIGERSISSSYTIPAAILPPLVNIQTVTQSVPSICSGGNLQLSATTHLTRAPLANYTFTTNTTGSLEPMVGSTTVLPSFSDDVPTAPLNIGFTFNLNQVDYTQCSISPDGWIMLGTNAAASQNSNSVTSATNVPKIYPYWDNIATGTSGSVETLLMGSAPNRIFIVQWLVTIPRNVSGPANSAFQLWLYETSNKIEFRYGSMGTTTTGSASSGITVNGTTYRSITFSSHTQSASSANNSNTTTPASGRMYVFALPAASSIVWSPATFLNTTSGSTVSVSGINTNTTYNLTATDLASGCTANYQHTVSVNPNPKAGFSINNNTQPRNTNAFILTDTSTGVSSRTWTFGDGNTGINNPVTKSYTAIGNYTVKLKVNTAAGCSDSIQKQVTVTSSTPTLYASNLQFSQISGTGMRLTWVNGNGQERMVLARANAAVNTTLIDNNTYPANTIFGTGTPLADGSFVVYRGTANTTFVSGLSIFTNYHFAVVEMSIDNGVNMYQPLPYLTGAGATLPVKWLSFEATLNSQKTVELNWATASETNNSHFVIERSEDLQHWEARGTAKGNGTVHTTSRYRFTDAVDATGAANLYYRIKQIDFNGKFEYSGTRSVVLEKTNDEIVLYPNPASTQVNIHHSFTNGVDVSICNLSGKVVFERQGATQDETIDLQNLPGGFYFIHFVENGKQVHSEKLLIQP